MKKFVALLSLVLVVGFVSAQSQPNESVKQSVDQKITKWDSKLEFSATQKEEIAAIMYDFEAKMQAQKKSLKSDRSNLKEINSNNDALREEMKNAIEAKLTPKQLKIAADYEKAKETPKTK